MKTIIPLLHKFERRQNSVIDGLNFSLIKILYRARIVRPNIGAVKEKANCITASVFESVKNRLSIHIASCRIVEKPPMPYIAVYGAIGKLHCLLSSICLKKCVGRITSGRSFEKNENCAIF